MADDEILELGETWDVDDQCECPAAPEQFLIPPPPPPPTLRVCGAGGDHYYCHLEPMGAEFTQSTFPSLPIIAVCSSVVLVAVLVASFLLWRHKTKVQNLLPCKHDHQGRCDLAAANGVTYEDVLINHHPTRLPQHHMAGSQALMPIELLDVKFGDIGPPQVSSLHHGTFYPCREGSQVLAGKHFNPVYEEVSRDSADKTDARVYDSDIEESAKGGRSLTSEDDFAEDEMSVAEYPSGEGSRHCSATSSVQGSTGGDLCKDPASSDEAASEDADYMVHGLPGMLTSDDSFKYPRKSLDMHALDKDRNRLIADDVRGGQDHIAQQPLLHSNISQPQRERTGSAFEMARNMKPGIVPLTNSPSHSVSGNVPHSSTIPVPSADSQGISPTRVMSSCSTFKPPGSSGNSRNHPISQTAKPPNVQWTTSGKSSSDPSHSEKIDLLHSPLPNPPSTENIYSIIDDREIKDSDLHPTTASRAHQQQQSFAPPKHKPMVPKKLKTQENCPKSPNELSQRNVDDENGSYGDIMPAFDNTSSPGT